MYYGNLPYYDLLNFIVAQKNKIAEFILVNRLNKQPTTQLGDQPNKFTNQVTNDLTN